MSKGGFLLTKNTKEFGYMLNMIFQLTNGYENTIICIQRQRAQFFGFASKMIPGV